MEPKRQIRAPKAEVIREATLSVRTQKRIKAIAEIAARESNKSMSNYIEELVLADLEKVTVDWVEDGEPGVGKAITVSGGRLLSDVIDEIYDDDDVICLLKRIDRPRYLSDEQARLNLLLRTSFTFYSKRGKYNEAAIREHWNVLCQLIKREPVEEMAVTALFPGVDVEFAVMTEAERIKLYRSNPTTCIDRNKAFNATIIGSKK